ncbi:hypothetical protein D9757_015045 [Collybiopsis confluens]|uniref:Ubiquitin-like protease family profile domain-containing protein n=1 Tax=Collybiopsis confluens TaxID=2823264 RepID=A0A8H5CMD6_9AGAR|nr:hypothetical protein D9757_015112 [Collybiopsis confluens]KAF5345372.1 hypothetical protein D9757_015045 [Collybiopsis confluens]
MATDYSQYQLFLDRQFHLPYSDGGDVKLYVDFETHSQHLRDTAAQLSASPVMNHPFTSCEHHVALPSDSRALAVVENLRLLLRCIRTKQVSLYNDWCIALDKFPAMTERMLRSLMNEAGHVSDHKWTKVAPVSYSDFATLGVGRWLNDVVINYFVQKWCSREGTTLGLSTYFAGKFLFQGNSCTTAKTGTLTLADEERVVKSCRRTMKIRGLEFWDSVFIPINENSSHWYSAYIDFRLKRIEIYDSLQGTCLANRRKPVLLRKNANLMLVLMWLTESATVHIDHCQFHRHPTKSRAFVDGQRPSFPTYFGGRCSGEESEEGDCQPARYATRSPSSSGVKYGSSKYEYTFREHSKSKSPAETKTIGACDALNNPRTRRCAFVQAST